METAAAAQRVTVGGEARFIVGCQLEDKRVLTSCAVRLGIDPVGWNTAVDTDIDLSDSYIDTDAICFDSNTGSSKQPLLRSRSAPPGRWPSEEAQRTRSADRQKRTRSS